MQPYRNWINNQSRSARTHEGPFQHITNWRISYIEDRRLSRIHVPTDFIRHETYASSPHDREESSCPLVMQSFTYSSIHVTERVRDSRGTVHHGTVFLILRKFCCDAGVTPWSSTQPNTCWTLMCFQSHRESRDSVVGHTKV